MKTFSAILLAIFAVHFNVINGEYPATSESYPEGATGTPEYYPEGYTESSEYYPEGYVESSEYYPGGSMGTYGYSDTETCGCLHKVGEGWTSQYLENCGLTPPKNGDPYGCGCASSCNFLGSNCECNCKWKPGFLRGCDEKPSSECPINY